jgi:hypothetical protein
MNSGRKGIRMSMTKTIAVFGVGPGMGRSVARRFGREGRRVTQVSSHVTLGINQYPTGPLQVQAKRLFGPIPYVL